MSNVLPFDPAARARRSRRPAEPPDDVLTVAETALALRLSVNTVYAYLADGTIPGKRVGRRWIISAARLEAWLLDPETVVR